MCTNLQPCKAFVFWLLNLRLLYLQVSWASLHLTLRQFLDANSKFWWNFGTKSKLSLLLLCSKCLEIASYSHCPRFCHYSCYIILAHSWLNRILFLEIFFPAKLPQNHSYNLSCFLQSFLTIFLIAGLQATFNTTTHVILFDLLSVNFHSL